jgi:hypothetical protein
MIQRVSIVGNVRRSSKDKWAYMLQSAPKGKSSGYDNVAERAAIYNVDITTRYAPSSASSSPHY